MSLRVSDLQCCTHDLLLCGAPGLNVADDGRLGETVGGEHTVLQLQPEALLVRLQDHLVHLRVAHQVVGQQR